MDQLPDPREDWDLKADRKLFAALQHFSASFLSRLKGTEAAVASLTKDTEDADVRAQCLQTSFRQLANSHYIKPVVSFNSNLSLENGPQLKQGLEVSPAIFSCLIADCKGSREGFA